MSQAATLLQFPLFARELTELAARRRTYLIRLAYASILLLVSWLAFSMTTLNRGPLALNYLGSGGVVLLWICFLQNAGLLIVLPALSCDVFTREKERQTLPLLFITKLHPATIVLEKYFSRLFPAICLLLISLPGLAFSYSLGGIESWQIINASVGLMVNAIVLTAVGVACSAYCRTSGSAYVMTLLVLLVTPLMVVNGQSGTHHWDIILGRYAWRDLAVPSAFATLTAGGSTAEPWQRVTEYLFGSLPSLLTALGMLAIARWVLIPRAFPAANSVSWKGRLARGLQRIGPLQMSWRRKPLPLQSMIEANVPAENPIAWRETDRHRTAGHVIRGCVLLFLLLMLMLAWSISTGTQYGPSYRRELSLLGLILWLTSLMTFIVKSATTFTHERSRQTLSVLLSTPMKGIDIVRQKMAGPHQWLLVFLIPMFICLGLRIYFETPRVHRLQTGQVDFTMALINEITMLVIYPQEVIWLAVYFGLTSKSSIAAILKSILTIIGMCLGPWLILFIFAAIFGGLNEAYFLPIAILLLFGPADLLLYGYSIDCIPPGFDEGFLLVIVNSLIHGGIWWGLRHYCLNHADALLGRQPRRQPIEAAGQLA